MTLTAEVETANGSSAMPADLTKPSPAIMKGSPAESEHSFSGRSERDGHPIEQMEQDDTEPIDAVSAKEAWNNPRINISRMAAVFLVS